MYAMLAIDLVNNHQHDQAEANFAHVADGFMQPLRNFTRITSCYDKVRKQVDVP